MEKFTSIFASNPLRCIVGEEKDKYLSLASFDNLKPFIPLIDAKNIDLLPISFDACVVNRGNKNGDIIDTDIALGFYKTFIWKFIDLEHSRTKVIGVVLSVAFSEFGTNKVLTEEDVKGKNTPFNITLGGVLWKAVNGDICDFIESAADPDSEDYLSASASWELGFSDFKIVELEQGSKNLSEGNIISDPEAIEKIKKYLKCFGGSGVKDGKSYFRMPSKNVIAMGVGLTEKPAAEVKGIAVKSDEKPQASVAETEASEDINKKNINTPVENISQSTEINVKRERTTNMKITSIADITDETLKQCTASVVTEFIQSELKKASDVFVADKSNQATAAQKLQDTTTALNTKLDEMKASLEALAKEKAEREKVDAFNTRMSEVVASYELPEDVTKIVVDDLKNLASAEAYASWKVKAETLLKPFSKAEAKVKADKKKQDDDAAEQKKQEEAKAAAAKQAKADEDGDSAEAKAKKAKEAKAATEAIAAVVENAIDNADKNKGGLPNSSSAVAQTLKEKFATAFASENFVIKK